MKAVGWIPAAFPVAIPVATNPMRKIPLGSLIALGLFVLFGALTAGGLWLERAHEISNHWYIFLCLEICAGVLSFPLVLLVILVDPQYEVGVVIFILAAVANCYMWGYCIAWIIRRRRFEAQGTPIDSSK
jgi:hypothetical protein